MIQFILDNNVFIIYVFMGLSLIFLVRTYYQWDRDGEMFIPVVALFCSFLIFFFLVLATGTNYPVSGGPWKQIYQNNVDATIELSYTDEGEKQTIVTGKSPVDLGTLQKTTSNYIFLEIELKAKSGDNTLFKRVGITQDNVIAKNVDPNNAKIAKIEYRPIKGVAPKLFGKQGKPRASEKEGEIRITFESSKDKKLEKLFSE